MTTGKKISEFTQLSSIADQDVLLTVDVSDTTSSSSGTTKKALFSTFKSDITSGLNISNWDAAFGWGNHATAGYQTDFTETDPVFSAHIASDITSTDIGQWNAAYGWGNHAVQGYLQSIAAISIDALNDVAINSSTLAEDQVIKWNGTSWVNGTGGSGTTINGLNDVGDVTITLNTLADNQILKYDSDSNKWRNEDFADITLSSFSVTTASASSTPSLSYDDELGVFTYTPPVISSFEVVNDTSPQLGGNLGLNNKNISGTGDININGDLKGDAVRLTNNATAPGSGLRREIKVIGQLPHFYDGTDWRPFFLINAPDQIPADTNWDDVMIRSTFDLNIDDVKYNVTPTKSNNANVQIVGSPTIVGNSSLSLNGAYLKYDVSDNGPGRPYNFNGAFTMEAWIYFNSNIVTSEYTPMVVFGGYGAGNSLDNWALTVWQNSNSLRFSWFNPNNPNHNTLPGTFMLSRGNATEEWHHVALVREKVSGDIVLYWDGNQSNSTDLVDNNILNPSEFRLGGQNDYGAVSIDAVYDDLRISSSDRYSSNFTASFSQLPISGTTTQILPPKADKKGEIELDSTSPAFKGSPGLTMTRTGAGAYRLTFASSYSATDDYYVMAQGMDHPGGAASYITITRSTAHVDISVKKQSDDSALDDGNVGVQIINHT